VGWLLSLSVPGLTRWLATSAGPASTAWPSPLTSSSIGAQVAQPHRAYADVKTRDGVRLFCIGFTKRRPNQARKTSYAQHSQIRAIRKKMMRHLPAAERADPEGEGASPKLDPGKLFESH